MGLKRNVSLATALRYKGQGPYLTYILHRIGGLGMAVFVTTHVLSTFFEERGWRIGNIVNDIYINPFFQIFFLFGVLFHIINGMRIIILDLVPDLILYHRQAIIIEWIVFILVYGLAVITTITTSIMRLG